MSARALLWSAGGAAAFIAAAAFLLWGFYGSGMLFDMIAVFCG